MNFNMQLISGFEYTDYYIALLNFAYGILGLQCMQYTFGPVPWESIHGSIECSWEGANANMP